MAPLDFDPIAEAHRQWMDHGWEDSAPGMAAVTTIARVHQILMRRVDSALEPHGLSFARFEILRLLSFTRHHRLPMGKIGERLQVHPASITEGVKRLEIDGLVKRVDHPADRRSTVAELLTEGATLLPAATAALNEVFESLGVPPGDLARLTSLLNLIRATAGDPVDFPSKEGWSDSPNGLE